MPGCRPTLREVWGSLGDVPDPEIPVVSITELGMVRDVAWEGDTLVVSITPTYSGCPAIALIGQLVEERLKSQGIDTVRVDQRISPPWTTAWLTDTARSKLKSFGIAPPIEGTAATGRVAARASRLLGDARRAVACPRCGSLHTELLSQFGSTPCKAAYRCKDCLDPFEYFKCL